MTAMFIYTLSKLKSIKPLLIITIVAIKLERGVLWSTLSMRAVDIYDHDEQQKIMMKKIKN